MAPKERLTIEQLRAEQVYIELTQKQKKLVETFIATNGDRVASVMAAYATKSEANARILAYEFFTSTRVVACLAAYFQDDPLDAFKAEVLKAYRNKKITVAQVNALKLHAQVNGWVATSLPRLNGRDAEPADDESQPSKPQTSVPASNDPAVPKRFKVGDRVTERDDEGVLHIGIVRSVDADGQVTDAEEVQA